MKIPCGKTSQPCKLFVGLAFALCCAYAQAQPQQQHHGPPSGQPQRQPSGQSVRKRWLAMPPDARQNFQRNAQLWMQMTPEQRNLMRQRENTRQQIMTRDADAAVRDSGLQLNPQERAQFESRYIQERRKVEQSLRQQSK